MVAVERVEVTEAGLVGDRGRAGKRAVTVIQSEHLDVIGYLLGRGPVAPESLRRNLVVEWINLVALKGRQVQVGSAVLEWTTICAPCSQMETALGHGGYATTRGHGGCWARVIRPGWVALGDPVVPVEDYEVTAD